MDKVFKINRTHIGAIRTQQSTQLLEVCRLLNITECEYCEHQYSQYERFAAKLAINIPDIRQRLRYSYVFRGFWNNEWASRNFEFLQFAYDSKYGIDGLTEEYKFMHDALRLIHDDEFYDRFENILKMIA